MYARSANQLGAYGVLPILVVKIHYRASGWGNRRRIRRQYQFLLGEKMYNGRKAIR
jgi:hypothetical protein